MLPDRKRLYFFSATPEGHAAGRNAPQSKKVAEARLLYNEIYDRLRDLTRLLIGSKVDLYLLLPSVKAQYDQIATLRVSAWDFIEDFDAELVKDKVHEALSVYIDRHQEFEAPLGRCFLPGQSQDTILACLIEADEKLRNLLTGHGKLPRPPLP